MKALVIADHNPGINVKEFVADNQIDLIITLGDLLREDLIMLEYITDIPKIGVYGNHDSGQYMDELGIWDMHLKTWTYQGITFGGFQGCVRYKPNPDAIMCTQEEASHLMAGFPRVDIFLTHCPPYGVNDEPEEIAHQGFKALTSYVEQQKPAVLLHGHTYPTDDTLMTQYRDTRIEYVTKYRIVSL